MISNAFDTERASLNGRTWRNRAIFIYLYPFSVKKDMRQIEMNDL